MYETVSEKRGAGGMNPKFIEHIHLDIPKPLTPKIDDFGNTVAQITNKAIIKAVEQIDDAILNEIVAIARSEGIDDIYLLDKKNIVSAFEKQIPKKVKRVTWIFKNENAMRLAIESDVLTKDNHVTINHCPCCDKEPIVVKYLSPPRYDLYCRNCGQALDWSDTE